MNQNFEKTYPHYSFAGLVGLAIAVAGLFTQNSEEKRTHSN
jgi:hypothetical protein